MFWKNIKKCDFSNKLRDEETSEKRCEGSLDNSVCLDVSVNCK